MRRFGVALALVQVASATPAQAQLLSPGHLAEPHADLEGVRNCTRCHTLGTRGIDPSRCLDCHTALADRIDAGLGYHGTVPRDACADCHPDHLGRDFDLLRIDEAAFDHDATGYTLTLGHSGVGCRDCHTSANVVDSSVRSRMGEEHALDRTFLGLDSECTSCHEADSPHGSALTDRTCALCHDERTWGKAPRFDHDRARFALDGRHRQVGCADCHGAGATAVYRPLASSSCADCHRDPHAGAMQGDCASCHTVDGWLRVPGEAVGSAFDHGRTRFPLVGAHVAADCSACHRRGSPPRSELVDIRYVRGTSERTFPTPVAASCASCHVDRHAFPDATGRWAGCADCHSEARWAPTRFGAERHRESAFPLTGAHTTTPCFACHQDPKQGHARFTLALGTPTCAACHGPDDPHEARYAPMTCDACHVTDAFDRVAFGHPEQVVAGRRCASCHEADDPHAGQFGDRDCSACHGTDVFTVEAFDHGATRFPLDGAHDAAPCGSCHVPERTDDGGVVRYRPLGFACTDCHGEAS